MKQSKWSQILQWTLIVIMVIVSLFPLYLVLINAFKSHADIVANPLSFPLELYWQNFTKAWKNGHFGQGFLNSLRLAAITALIVLTASSLAGYVLGMKKFRGQKLVHVYFLMAMTVPVQLFLFPLYGALAKLGLIGSVYAVCFIIAAVNMPLAVMMVMVRPGMITVAVLIILNAWNEYLISSTFLQGEENFTVTLGYLTLNGASVTFDQGMKMAGALMIIVPILIFFLSLQRYFVDGLANGSLKE